MRLIRQPNRVQFAGMSGLILLALLLVTLFAWPNIADAHKSSGKCRDTGMLGVAARAHIVNHYNGSIYAQGEHLVGNCAKSIIKSGDIVFLVNTIIIHEFTGGKWHVCSETKRTVYISYANINNTHHTFTDKGNCSTHTQKRAWASTYGGPGVSWVGSERVYQSSHPQ